MPYYEWQLRDIMMLALDQASDHVIKCTRYQNEGVGHDPEEVGFIAACDDGKSFKITIVGSV